nr:mucin-2-like [Dermacentor andersoni]
MGTAAEADTAELCPEAQRPRRFPAKYVCIAGSLVALVLLALALSYPISSLFGGKRLDDAYKNASVDENEIDDSAPDGYRPTRDGFKPDVSENEKEPPLSSTPASTTESTTTTTTTPSTTTTTQSTTTSTTTMTPETTTEQPSTERATRRHRRSHRDVPETTTAVSPTNRTSRIRPWLNRTRGPAVPGYVSYEISMKKVSVQVVYECLCPHSRRFIVSQLLPVYELLREYMHLTLLPFGRARVENGSGSSGGDDAGSNNTAAVNNGNSTDGSDGTDNTRSSISTESPDSTQGSTDSSASANTTDADSDGRGNSSEHNSTSSPTIRCTRGSKECHANMVQTCVMRHVEETLTAVRIIACMSRHPDPHRVGRRCVEQHGVEWHLVDQCVTAEGKLLMLDMGKKTWLITASVNSTPLVRIQGEMSHIIQVEAQTNLLGLMCDRLHNRHEACRGRANGTTTAQEGLVGDDASTTATPPRTTTLTPSTGC